VLFSAARRKTFHIEELDGNNQKRICKTSAAIRPAAETMHASGPHTAGKLCAPQ
jgi:hypothetical protein